MTEEEGRAPKTPPLHPLERRVLESLKEAKTLDFDSLVSATGLVPDQVRRAVSWLSSKGLLALQEESRFTLTTKGGRSPPELLLLDVIEKRGGPVPLSEVRRSFDSDQEFSAAVGRATRSGWVSISGGGASGPVARVKTSTQGPIDLRELLSLLADETEESSLPPGLKPLADDLFKRGLVNRKESKRVRLSITQKGLQALREAQEGERRDGTRGLEYVDRLTPEVIASIRSTGKDVTLRPLDVSAPAPRSFPGRRHPVKEFINEVREAYLSMGFTEIVGDAVQNSFWNFDALFTPQDHPARELQDTFYVKGLRDIDLARTGVVADVASTHENGWKTGSMGWGYAWNIEEAKRLVLRTHNTALTIRATMDSKDSETRVFSVGKVYRNESIDFKHLAEFHQMEGIIVGEGLNVRDLMGVLARFYGKLGMHNIKFWPSYFPYTEPSIQVMFHDDRSEKWLEMGGSGVFRPEVALPLGVRKPVLAWGLGLERVLALRMGLQGIREFYASDLEWLRRRREIASSQDIL